MKQLNGLYAQRFNQRHKRVGHLFQGRYQAILVDKDNYLLELCRYVVLNPVRAKIVKDPKDWRWSAYQATTGYKKGIPCLTTDFHTLNEILKPKDQKSKEQAMYKAHLQYGYTLKDIAEYIGVYYILQ